MIGFGEGDVKTISEHRTFVKFRCGLDDFSFNSFIIYFILIHFKVSFVSFTTRGNGVGE
jgi:hypothetical protein